MLQRATSGVTMRHMLAMPVQGELAWTLSTGGYRVIEPHGAPKLLTVAEPMSGSRRYRLLTSRPPNGGGGKGTSAHEAFAALGSPTVRDFERQAIRFANRWGRLGIAYEWRPGKRRPAGVPPEAELLWLWEVESTAMWHVLRVHARRGGGTVQGEFALRVGPATGGADGAHAWRVGVYRPGAMLPTEMVVGGATLDPRAAGDEEPFASEACWAVRRTGGMTPKDMASSFVAAVLAHRLASLVKVRALPDRNGPPSLQVGPENLLGALWLQCAMALRSGHELRMCAREGCPNAITAKHRSRGRTDHALYCGGACRTRAHRQRRVTARPGA